MKGTKRRAVLAPEPVAAKRDLVDELRWTANLYDPACPSHGLLMRAANEIETLRKEQS